MCSHTTGWELMDRAAAEMSRAEFEARPDFGSLIAEAARRGYRRITLHEQINPGSVDAYSWRGGVWVPA